MASIISRFTSNFKGRHANCFKVLKPLYLSNAYQQVRTLILHEHENMKLLQDSGVVVPPFGVAYTPAEAKEVAISLGSTDLVVKAQVHAGGRGKGIFDNGFKGGVHLVNSANEVQQVSDIMLGSFLKTAQTQDQGVKCNKVLIAKQMPIKKEFYFAITNDAFYNGPFIMTSSQGGMDIEKVDPNSILKFPLDFENEFSQEKALEIAKEVGFSEKAREKAALTFRKLFELFSQKDCLMLEINPLCEGLDGEVSCLDAKFQFDDNAFYRQKDLFKLKDWTQRDEREKVAYEQSLNFIPLKGNIACMVNGAGLAMATMDIIKLDGGAPANFLDIGGGATSQSVNEAFKLIIADPKVKVILVNIFGGIIQCDLIAQGIIDAKKNLKFDSPIVCRLQGSRMKEAKELLESSGLEIVACQTFEEASKKAVELAKQL